jgi:wyosine [tRNA(Phe)-imidazoG37] synthetase (radical SAM superfamily)
MSELIRIDKVKGLVAGIVFGPVRSRRFGRSLGINLSPRHLKLCSFDCPYCECGLTARGESRALTAQSPEAARQAFPSTEEVLASVRAALDELARRGETLDSLTFTGNGEMTLHPDFEPILDGVIALRNEQAPRARIVVLTNGTRLGDPSVRRALERVDQCVVKIDAGREETFRAINRPVEDVSLEAITEAAARLPRVIVQTMFVRTNAPAERGTAHQPVEAESGTGWQPVEAALALNNTTPEEIEAWIERVARIRPAEVQLYSLERHPAEPGLEVVPRDELERIAAHLANRTGLKVSVY